MKTRLFMLASLMLAAVALTGCSSDEENVIEPEETLTYLNTAPNKIVEKGSMPEWLVVKINQLETNPKPLSQYRIYEGVWKSQPIFYIYDYFASCMYCSVYTYDGHNINWETGEYDFKDFACIFQIFYLYLQQRIINKTGGNKSEEGSIDISNSHSIPFADSRTRDRQSGNVERRAAMVL